MKKKTFTSPNSHLFKREDSYILPDGKVVEKGQVIKISGEHGVRFRFHSHVTRMDSGIEWIDCFELQKGTPSGWRSFRAERIKVIPVRRRRNKKKAV